MRNTIIFILLFLLPIYSCTKDKSQQKPPIIDMHLHAFDLKIFKEKYGYQSDFTQKEYMEVTLEILEHYNILGVASGQNNVVKEWQKASPSRIIPGYAFYHPNEVNTDSLRLLIKQDEIKVIGEMMTQCEGIAPGDSLMEPIWNLAEEFDIPVGLHMGPGGPGAAYKGFPNYRAHLSNPFLLEEVLIQHPNLRIYIMHAAWPMLDELIHLLYAHPQVYVDVGIIDWGIPREEFHFYLHRIVGAGYGKRVMYGSDQMIWPSAIEKSLEAIESAEFLSEEQKRDILYNNAARFLRLDSTVTKY